MDSGCVLYDPKRLDEKDWPLAGAEGFQVHVVHGQHDAGH